MSTVDQPLKPALQRGQFITRLSAAAGMLLGARHRDGAHAVQEAIEIIRGLPFAEAVNEALHPPKDQAEPHVPMRGWLSQQHGEWHVHWGEKSPHDNVYQWTPIIALTKEK